MDAVTTYFTEYGDMLTWLCWRPTMLCRHDDLLPFLQKWHDRVMGSIDVSQWRDDALVIACRHGASRIVGWLLTTVAPLSNAALMHGVFVASLNGHDAIATVLTDGMPQVVPPQIAHRFPWARRKTWFAAVVSTSLHS
jgi:hypothetical protein